MKKILIIEDDEQILNTLNDLLVGRGYICYKARDGATGLGLALLVKPDLILIDIMLPDYGGIETCIAIRDHETISSSIIILTAAYISEVRSALDGLVQLVVQKPINSRSILASIIELLGSPNKVMELNNNLQLAMASK